MTVRLGTLVAELSDAGTGVNKAVRGIVQTHDGEIEAFVKRLSDSRELLIEVVAAGIARRMGLPVPEPLLVFVPELLGGPAIAFGSAAIGHPNLMAWVETGNSAVMRRLKAWKHLIPAACFDEWIANCDRHMGNLLYGGDEDFWLIDHGLAMHQHVPVDALAPINQLFTFATDGISEGDLLMLRPKVLGVMQSYGEHETARTRASIPQGVCATVVEEEVFSWLTGRQNHLVRLGSERVPARQSELFDGRHGH